MIISDLQTRQTYYAALVARDSSFIGSFYVGVTSTNIFCIPTCRARKPKFENTVYYTDLKDLLDHGYRPCKVCRPTESAFKMPFDVEEALSMLKSNPKNKVKDYDLKSAGISPYLVRRWFQKHYGLTFQAYQRMYRINHAYIELKEGKNIAEAAYNNGYESLSGFNYTYKKLVGVSPKQKPVYATILLHRFTTPLGPMFVGATDKGVCLLEFTDRRMLETELKDLQKLLQAKILVGENTHSLQLQCEIMEYFAGTRQTFAVALDTPGTEFQRSVWKGLRNVRYGKTSTYIKQALGLRGDNTARAVAIANGFNRVSIVVPCHRIIGSDGSLTGYGGGLARKKWLLDHESKSLLHSSLSSD